MGYVRIENTSQLDRLSHKKWPGVRRDKVGSNADPNLFREPSGKLIQIPQPGSGAERFDPLSETRRIKLREALPKLEEFTANDPTLQPCLDVLQAIARGESVQPTKPWLTRVGNAPSMAETVEKRTLGGCVSKEPFLSRQRAAFTSKRDQKLLNSHGGKAHCHQTRWLKQHEVPRPRPPPLRGPKGPREHEPKVLEHIRTLVELELAGVVPHNDSARHTLICSVFPQFKPSDLLRENPRMCLNLKASNVPVKETAPKRKFPTGTSTMRKVMQKGDTAALLDATKGYHQVGLTKESAALQRFLVQFDLLNVVLASLGKNQIKKEDVLTMIVDGVLCVVMEPWVVMFGSTLSRNQFEDRFQMALNFIRILGGIRIVTQVDDAAILSNQGPTATYADMILSVMTLTYFGWIIHLEDAKAKELWPRSLITFDGRLWRPEDLTFFSPKESDERHRVYLLALLAKCDKGLLPTFQEVSRVLGQIQSHCDTHDFSSFLKVRAQTEFNAELSRWTRSHPHQDPWEERMPRLLSSQARADLLTCSAPRETGRPFRAAGPIELVITADSSDFASGVLLEHKDGRKLQFKQTLPPQFKSAHHTPKELIGVALAAEAGIRHFDVKASAPTAIAIEIRNDNTAAVKNLRRPGGKASMVLPQLPLIVEAATRGIMITASHQGKDFMDNLSQCDSMGRTLYKGSDLGVLPSLMRQAILRLDPDQSHQYIDCFSTLEVKQTWCKRFISRFPHPEAWATDALAQDFQQRKFLNAHLYCFPPERMIHRLLQQLKDQKTSAVVVVPYFQRRPQWWQMFLNLAVKVTTIQTFEGIYVHPAGPHRTDGNTIQKSPLIVAMLSGNWPGQTGSATPSSIPSRELINMGLLKAIHHGSGWLSSVDSIVFK